MRRRLRIVAAAGLLGGCVVPGITTTASAALGPPPTGLTVDGRAHPLTAARVPSFGWLPHSTHGNARQSAYRVVVVDRATGQTRWDSGRVASAEQSWVPYAGAPLGGGRDYRWSVRTWDERGAASSWSRPASFDVAIGDREWTGAEWIRRVTTGNDSVVDYTLARRAFALADRGSPIRRARAYITTVGKWELRVNGNRIDSQYSYQMPGEGLYDVVDITNAVEQARRATGSAAGRVALGVRYAAWPTTEGSGRPEGPVPWRTTLTADVTRGAITLPVQSIRGLVADERIAVGVPGSRAFEVVTIAQLRPHRITLTAPVAHAHAAGTDVVSENGPSGLLVRVVVDHADGQRQTVVSNGAWLVAKDAEELTTTVKLRSSENAGSYVEYVDARRALTGWDQVGYHPGAHWSPAVSLGPHPLPNPSDCDNYLSDSSPCGFTHLVPMQSRLTTERVHPVSLRQLTDGVQVADFGASLVGVPVVHFRHGGRGHSVVLVGSYRLDHTNLIAPAAPGVNTIVVSSTCGFAVGDPITVDAAADGYGAGNPEHRVITQIAGLSCGAGTLTLDSRLTKVHLLGRWVEGARVGRRPLDTQGTDLSFHYVQTVGEQTIPFFVGQGFRYLEISGAEQLRAGDLWVEATHTEMPAEHAATFRSSNPMLDAVFALMQRSARYAAQQSFNDSPDRQDGQFLGDAVNESFATLESLGERALTRQAVEVFARSQVRYWLANPARPGSTYGELNAVYPTGDGRRDIPDYSEMYPEWVWRYYLLTGDAGTLARAYPTMRRVVTYVTNGIATTGPARGLIYELAGGGTGQYQHGIVDWPPPMRYDTAVLNRGVDTVVNLRGVEVFRSVAAAARTLGRTADAAAYTSAMDRLISAINDKLVDPGGYYDDGLFPHSGIRIGNHSQHDQSFAVTYGVAPKSAYQRLGRYIASAGMRQGPMTLGQLEQALIATGRTDALVALLTDPDQDGPAKILAQGGTSMWEQWNPGCYVYGGYPGGNSATCHGPSISELSTDSFSHGWGSVGIVGILRGLLGVSVTGPGARTIAIAPPAHGLASASGSVWTERGRVSVSWSFAAHLFELTVDVPDNVVATVRLPAGGFTSFAATGDGAPALLGVHNGRADYRVGSGHSTFRASH